MAQQAGTMVIVGAGMAGANAALTLREEGYRGRILLVGDEPVLPFGRPPLSKGYLVGTEDLSGWYVRPPGWYEANGVELKTGVRVEAIHTETREVRIAGGTSVRYDGLLLATGGRNRQLPLRGSDLPGIFQLRTLADCDAIKVAAAPDLRAVVVGLGFIGSEVTSSLTTLGLKVTAVGSGGGPLAAVLGDQVGAVLADIHMEKGVELVLGDQVVGFEGTERVEVVHTRYGRRILVDSYCRADADRVCAAGDVANHLHPIFGRLRVEHYNNAEKMGRAAARTMLGRAEVYDYVHSFWSDQYEHKLEYIGFARRWDQFVVRGRLEERHFLSFYLSSGKLVAAVGLNRGGDPELDEPGELSACRRLIAVGDRVDPAQLADDRVDIRSLAA